MPLPRTTETPGTAISTPMRSSNDINRIGAEMLNTGGTAEGSNAPPLQAGSYRVPIPNGFKVSSQSYDSTTLSNNFILVWQNVDDPTEGLVQCQVAGYKIYAQDLISANTNPTFVGDAPTSPCLVSIVVAASQKVTFFLQPYLTSGQTIPLSACPTCTGTTQNPPFYQATFSGVTVTIGPSVPGFEVSSTNNTITVNNSGIVLTSPATTVSINNTGIVIATAATEIVMNSSGFEIILSSGVTLFGNASAPSGGSPISGFWVENVSTGESTTLAPDLIVGIGTGGKTTFALANDNSGISGVLRLFNGSGSGGISGGGGGNTIFLDGSLGRGTFFYDGTHSPILIQDGTAGDDIGIFPGSVASATAGSATLPAHPVGFMIFSVGGTTAHVPYYA